MKRKWMSCIAAAVLLMMMGSNAAIAAPKYQWRIASEEIAGSVADMYAHEFARLLKEKSKGAIQLDVYPSGTLGSPTEMFELTLNGAVEFCLTGPGQSGSIVPENQIFGLHFLFSDNQKVNDTFLATSKAINEQLNAIYELFPILKERSKQSATTLSGGEQQQLAIARALVSSPRLLLVDEVSMGLMPKLTEEVFEVLKKLNKDRKLTILLVEQNALASLRISDRGYVLETGNINIQGTTQELMSNPKVREAYLGG